MILYVNGDSHSAGTGLNVNESYPALLADYLNAQLINQSFSGASNQRILRTTREFLETTRPDVVVIGWSTWEREEWEHRGNFYNVNSSPPSAGASPSAPPVAPASPSVPPVAPSASFFFSAASSLAFLLSAIS